MSVSVMDNYIVSAEMGLPHSDRSRAEALTTLLKMPLLAELALPIYLVVRVVWVKQPVLIFCQNNQLLKSDCRTRSL